MPYSHFHNWSFHTHHRQPKGGNHYNAVRRRQRPWRIGFVVVLIGSLACLAVFAGLRFDTQVEAVKTFVVGNAKEQSQRQEERAQTRVAKEGIEKQTRTANEGIEKQTRTANEGIERQTRVANEGIEKQTRTANEGIERQTRVTIQEMESQTRVANEDKKQEQHERAIVSLINQERNQRGIREMTWDPKLQAIARAHSRDMSDRGYFDHTNRSGLDYRQRAIAAGYDCPNLKWQGVAENLYFGSRGHQSPQAAVNTWLDSPLHKRAMLDSTFSKAAIGVHEGYLAGYGYGYFTTLLLC